MTKTAKIIKFAVFSVLSAWSAIYFLNVFTNLPQLSVVIRIQPLSFIKIFNPSGFLESISNLTFNSDWVLTLFMCSWFVLLAIRVIFATDFIKKVFRFNVAMITIVSLHAIKANVLDTPLFSLLIWLIIVWMLVSVIAMAITYKYLEVIPYLDSNVGLVTKADDAIFIIKIKLPTWYRWIPFNWGATKIDVTYGVEGYEKNYVTHGISDETKLEVKMGFDYKGHYKLGVYEIKLTDTLGIVSKDIKFELTDAKIYPQVISVKNKMNFAFNGDDEAMKQLIRKGEKFDTRLMIPGDSMKRVNWQLFAKQGDIFVRHEEVSSFIGARTIFYDNRSNIDIGSQKIIDEKMTEVLISAVDNFLLNKEEYKLLRFSREDVVFEKYKLKKFENLIDEISFIPFVKDVSKKQLTQMKKNIQVVSRDGDVIIITSNPDRYIFEQCLAIKKSQGNPKVIFVAHNNLEVKGIDDFWNKLGVKVIKVNSRKNVKEYRGEIL